MDRAKRCKQIHTWVDDEMKAYAIQDAQKESADNGSLSAMIRRLIRENHEKNITKTSRT